MGLTIQTDAVPLRTDEYGVIRVGDSQVVLDVVIREYENGACPEDIAHSYSTLQLADIYAVLAYYLRHQEEIERYLQTRRVEAGRLRQEIESRQSGRAGLRKKLLARKRRKERANASPRQ